MKICDLYSHLFAIERLEEKGSLLSEIESILTDKAIIFGRQRPNEIKQLIGERFSELGWADKIKVGQSRLTISFSKQKVGICFQLGNVARTYADLLKLMQLYKRNVIQVGILVVPHKSESKKLGANYAQFERLSSEIKHFTDIINIPILVIGLSN